MPFDHVRLGSKPRDSETALVLDLANAVSELLNRAIKDDPVSCSPRTVICAMGLALRVIDANTELSWDEIVRTIYASPSGTAHDREDLEG